jgi:UDP-GlcNAc3NAcA epimerase
MGVFQTSRETRVRESTFEKVNDAGDQTPVPRASKPRRIVSVVGARPQFIKAATVCDAFAELNHAVDESRRIKEVVVHTGQHYDYEMSENLCSQLGLAPVTNLGINGGTQAEQTAAMIRELERVFVAERPDMVLLYGDTNSTLAGALAAAKLGITIAHVEAGLRSFNRAMPEEINRVVTDHVANLFFAPTSTAVSNLRREGIDKNVFLVGDVMYDAIQRHLCRAERNSRVLEDLGLQSKKYILVTVHRAENTNATEQLQRIVAALADVSLSVTVVWPMHPRTRQALKQAGAPIFADGQYPLRIIGPASYLDMLVLERNAQTIVTDSGGVQKEAAWLGVPCVTLRDETEWIETVQSGWNVLAGTERTSILNEVSSAPVRTQGLPPFPAQGGAARDIVRRLAQALT